MTYGELDSMSALSMNQNLVLVGKDNERNIEIYETGSQKFRRENNMSTSQRGIEYFYFKDYADLGKKVEQNRTESKKKIDDANALFLSQLLQASNQSQSNSTQIPSKWTVQAQGVGSCYVKNIRLNNVRQNGDASFSINFECKKGSAGSAGVGNINCSSTNNGVVKSTNYIARCIKNEGVN